MKYIWLIPIFFPLIMALPYLQDTELSSCDFEWVLTNLTVDCTNDSRTINATITFGESTDSSVYPVNEPSSPIYQIRVTIHDCKNRTDDCTGEPITTVNNINCNDQNLPSSDVEPCTIAQEMGKLKMEQQMIFLRYGRLGEMIWPMYCFDAESIGLDGDCLA